MSDRAMTADEVNAAIAARRAKGEGRAAAPSDCKACGHPYHAGDCLETVETAGEKFYCQCEGYEGDE